MVDEKIDEIRNAIWLTSRGRMHAEKRFRKYDRVAHLMLSWLSLSVIAWAVVRGSITSTAHLDIYTAILSVFVFAFSVGIFGFRFGETAALHRECYLRLQKLYDSEFEGNELKRQYYEILGGYGNHSDWDYESLILDRTLIGGRKVWGRDGEEITWTGSILVKHFLLSCAFWLCTIAIFSLGLGTYYLIATQLP
ncbi:MAG: SLATT domain-containing protein [Pseudomonadota bacterium]